MVKLTNQPVYLRKHEQQTIKNFITSDSTILHIYGNPGTGKTITTLHTLSNINFSYFNYLENTTFYKTKKMKKIVVIDEFDRFYDYKKRESTMFISRPNHKFITLANKCIFANSFQFTAYKTDEMIYLLSKLNKKLSNEKLKYIAKKFHGQGDLRRAVEYSKNSVDENEVVKCDDENVNHRIVKEMVRMGLCKADVYGRYVEVCKESMVPYLGRCDFFVLYDMYS